MFLARRDLLFFPSFRVLKEELFVRQSILEDILLHFCWVLDGNDVIMKNSCKVFFFFQRVIKNKQLTLTHLLYLLRFSFRIHLSKMCSLHFYVRSFFNYSIIRLPFIHFVQYINTKHSTEKFLY